MAPIQDIDEAYRRLDEDETDAAANAFVGLEALHLAEKNSISGDNAFRGLAVRRLETATRSGNGLLNAETYRRSDVLTLRLVDWVTAEHWYLLGRAHLGMPNYRKAYEAFQQAVYRNERIPDFWITIGILFYRINQSRDALDAFSRAVRLKPGLGVTWYNIGVLVRHD